MSDNKFNKITGFFPNKNGSGKSVGVTAEIVAALEGIEVGDRIFLNGLDGDRPFISYAKSDPAFQKREVVAAAPTAPATKTAGVRPGRVEKF